MRHKALRTTLGANVSALMLHAWGEENLTKLGREAHVSAATVQRIRAGTHGAGIDILEKIARVFGIQPWQLLVPNLDPASLPALLASAADRAVYDNLMAAIKAATKQ